MTTNKLWWKNGIIYQIYPRSFQDTNGDGIGDLAGIIQHLDYLQDLGVDGIWLSPINPSPDADFGYDVSDYHTIDTKYGNLQDFDRLLNEAHKRDIHIIMDLVLNHTSDQHRWFQESKKSVTNPYHNWYIWREGKPDGGKPNNWLSHFGGSGWEFDQNLGKYYYHMFNKRQPDLNWRNPEVRSTMLDIFRYWLDRGVDGFRLDVFNNFYKDSDFKDNPKRSGIYLRKFNTYEHLYDTSQPEMIDVVKDIRKITDEYPERYVVGETFLADSAHARTYIGEDRLYAGFDYAYTETKFSARAFGKTIQFWDSLHGEEAWPNYFFNNHDTKRSSTKFAKGEDDAILKLLAAMHLTVRGTPYLYYGEEIGMRDVSLTRSQIQDPVGKHYWPFYQGRDGCRSPMQWSGRENAGFTTGTPWLHLNKDYKIRNVENQARSAASLLTFYKEMIQLRRKFGALNAGSLELVPNGDADILAYERKLESERILILLNFSEKIKTYDLPTDNFNKWELLYAGNEAVISYMAENQLHLPRYGFGILISRSE